jgi:glycerophosphoryl diester phosphodiesterase
MLIIAHRGNVNGPDASAENTVAHVDAALAAGFDVEVDVWKVGEAYMLGHDAPEIEVNAAWLRQPGMWCHAKNVEALVSMQSDSIHCFWHETDAYTVTSRNRLWCYPGNFDRSGITVVTGGPETATAQSGGFAGVCTDHAEAWRAWAEAKEA